MKPVYVQGIGVLARSAQTPQALALSLETQSQTYPRGPISYQSVIPPAKLRRCSAYVKLTCEAAERAAQDANLSPPFDPFRVGTIFSTGYGAVESNLQFGKTVIQNKPILCSPAVFAGTVPNAGLGQVCILGGYRGYSTLLMGGDPVEYSALLLQRGAADVVLCGAVEAYSEALFTALAAIPTVAGADLAEGAAVLALSGTAGPHTYARILATASAGFAAYPYRQRLSKAQLQSTVQTVLHSLQAAKPEAVLLSANGTYVDAVEKECVHAYFPEARMVTPKTWLGETLGAGYMLNIAQACACVRQGLWRRVLALGIDPAGNFMGAIIERHPS